LGYKPFTHIKLSLPLAEPRRLSIENTWFLEPILNRMSSNQYRLV
jgi:hypothetical protein